MAYRLGVDVGGTFTDLFLVNDEDGTQHRVKTPTTPSDPSQGVLNGVARICETAGITPGDLGNIMHGTTVATNAVLEGKGARVGLITTQGFQQILHLARSQTPGPLAGWIIMQKPEPPATLADTREAVERMGPRGETVVPVDEQQVEAIVKNLVESGVESLTVGLIIGAVGSGQIASRMGRYKPLMLGGLVLMALGDAQLGGPMAEALDLPRDTGRVLATELISGRIAKFWAEHGDKPGC